MSPWDLRRFWSNLTTALGEGDSDDGGLYFDKSNWDTWLGCKNRLEIKMDQVDFKHAREMHVNQVNSKRPRTNLLYSPQIDATFVRLHFPMFSFLTFYFSLFQFLVLLNFFAICLHMISEFCFNYLKLQSNNEYHLCSFFSSQIIWLFSIWRWAIYKIFPIPCYWFILLY